MASTWEPFLIPKNDAYPQLFIQRNFTKTTYSVFITDLSSIWGESLSKSSILDRADDQNASIDPSLNDGQLEILLTHLHDALMGTRDGVEVDMDVKKQDSGCVLHISTTEDLPKPLRKLFWKFRLKPLSQAILTKQFTIPLVSLAATFNHEVKSLTILIKEKDIVIQRFLDWFDNAKIDMRTVFPGYKKGVRLAGKGKGLEPFNVETWRAELSHETDEKDMEQLVKDAYDDVNDQVLSKSAAHSQSAFRSHDSWWEAWSGKVNVERFDQIQEIAKHNNVPKETKDSSDEEDDFAVITPSVRETQEEGSIKDSSNIIGGGVDVSMKDDDETTTDEGEDDLDIAPNSSFKRKDYPPSSATADGSDSAISSYKEKETEIQSIFDTVSEDPSSPVIQAKEAMEDMPASHITISDNDDDDKTDDEMDIDAKAVITHVSPVKAAQKGKIKKTIGGKKKNEGISNSTKEEESKIENEALPVPIISPKKRTPSPGPEIEENADEKADRIRKELAASLEAKKKAPQKKKRRF